MWHIPAVKKNQKKVISVYNSHKGSKLEFFLMIGSGKKNREIIHHTGENKYLLLRNLNNHEIMFLD